MGGVGLWDGVGGGTEATIFDPICVFNVRIF